MAEDIFGSSVLMRSNTLITATLRKEGGRQAPERMIGQVVVSPNFVGEAQDRRQISSSDLGSCRGMSFRRGAMGR